MPYPVKDMDFVPLAEALRGSAVESVHHGAVAVVDSGGELVASAGNPRVRTFSRSSLKPFQALPLVARGGHEKFGFTAAELAVICASHSGEPRHVDAVRSILRKIGRREDDLQCGVHAPYHYNLSGQRPAPDEVFTPAQNNCSGKHSGMLALCVLTGTPHENYLDFDHPIQREIRRAVAAFTGVPEADLAVGTDGCSAPNFALPLVGMARAFARLAREEPDPDYGEAPRVIFQAMTSHPGMVSGEGRNDLAIMKAGRGDWVAKIGGEAIQGVGIRSRGQGIAIKIADGNSRALHPVTVEVLRQLGLVPDPEATPLAPFRETTIKNHRAIETGVVRPTFTLNTHLPKPAARTEGT